MSPSPDPTADSLLRGLQQALQSFLDAHPGQERPQVSRLYIEMWRDQAAAIRLLLQVQPGSRMELAIGLGSVGFLIGLAASWLLCY